MTLTEPVQLAVVATVSSVISTTVSIFSTRSKVASRLARIERIQSESMRLLLKLAEKEGISVNPLVMELMQLPLTSSATSAAASTKRPVVGFRTTSGR